ncbi:hypothetical protein CSCA_3156 [Clostridium scatologenes]|uniref:Uncharacterized protein n=1 Tax=Clostridium scatologenes TaxID=1548 RepID=A0A0E3GRG5_CLOSL|nr:hypothetical protein CSCA_3156 [Clostridium scatologenes]
MKLKPHTKNNKKITINFIKVNIYFKFYDKIVYIELVLI